MCAIAAIDTALWDIKAKAAGLPLYQLLGGRSRSGVMVYGHANGRDIAETADEVQRYIELGYLADPGAERRSRYGRHVRRFGRQDVLRAAQMRSCPPRTSGAPRSICSTCRGSSKPCAHASGRRRILLHDVHHRLTPIEAARLGKSLEPYRLFWLEDPTPAENQANFRLIRQHTVTPLAVGEVFNTIWDCKQLIEEQLIDYIRTTLVHAGGLTHLRRIADFASLYNVRLGCHGATDLSPVCMGAALHLNTAIANFGIQEYMRHTPETDAVFPHDYRYSAGYLLAGESPGHGVDLDESLASKYPYRRAYLPVNRLEDGTLWSW